MTFSFLSALIFSMIGLWLTEGMHIKKNSSDELIMAELGPPMMPVPVNNHRWRLIDETPTAKHNHYSSTNYIVDTEKGPLENLQDAWEDKMGKGFPTFIVRKIDFHEPGFTYMWPAGEPTQQQVYNQGIFEPFLSFHLIGDINECCKAGNGHFLDVGAQYGWYSILSASLGCQVDTFEPVPWSEALLTHNIKQNNNPSLIIRQHPGKFLGNKTNSRHTIIMPTHGNGDTNYEDGEEKCNHGALCRDVTATTIDNEINVTDDFHSCAVKIDAEGMEAEIVQGAENFFREKMPKILIMEVSPGMKKTLKHFEAENVKMLQYLTKLGYIPYLLKWDLVRTYNVNVAEGNIESKKSSKPIKDMLKECGVSCVMYFKRSW